MKEFDQELGYPEESQSLAPVYRGLGLGRNLKGFRLESFTEQSAINALTTWEEISVRRSDAGQSITAQDYREFAERVGYLGHNALRLGLEWSKSGDPSRKSLGEAIVLSQSVGSVLIGIDGLFHEYPEAKIDIENLIQEGIIKSWTLFDQLPPNGDVGKVLVDTARATFELGKTQIEQNEGQLTSEFGSFSREELEKGEFVAANLEPVIDPIKEMERKEFNKAIYEAVDSLVETPEEMAQAAINLEKWRAARKPKAPTEQRPVKEARPQDIKKKWAHWRQLARFGGVAAVVVLGLIGSTRLVSAAVENNLQVKFHNGRNLGVAVEWSELGPIEPTKPAWLGDELPLVPTQVQNRKSIDVSAAGGIRSGETGKKRVPVIRRDSEGKILSFTAYPYYPIGRIVLDGNQYVVRLESDKAKPKDTYIECIDENFRGRIIFKAPVPRVEIERECTWTTPWFEVFDPATKEIRVIAGGASTRVEDLR